MQKKDLKTITAGLILLSTILSIYFLGKFTLWADKPEHWGQFGDLVGGIIGTIFALLSVILLIGTLRYQIKASKEQNIEDRMFQLLSIHRDNVNQIEGKRKFFKEAIDLFWKIREQVDLCEEAIRNSGTVIDPSVEWTFDPSEKSNIAYLILFFGTDLTDNESLKERICEMSYCSILITEVLNNLARFDLSSTPLINIRDGIQYAVGHYYRHLYQSVNFINNSKILSYKKKYFYVKTLRAQISTYEQMLFYINSISRLGEVWELTKNDENSKLITKYNLIKNIPIGTMGDISPHIVYELVIYENLYPEELEQIQNLRKLIRYS